MTFDDLYGTSLDLEINNSDSAVLFTTARRKAAVNAGLREFADLTECYVRRSTIAVSCNTTEYSLVPSSTDYSRLSAVGLPEYRITSSNDVVTILAGDDFPRRDELWNNRVRSGWRQSTTPTTPTSYYLRPDGGQMVLGLDCRPKVGSSETAVLIVPYVARPPALSASTDVPFTDTSGTTRHDLTVYHQALVHYAAYKLLPLEGDVEGSRGQLALFLDYVKRYLSALRPKGGTHITLARHYLGDARRVGEDDDCVPVTQWS